MTYAAIETLLRVMHAHSDLCDPSIKIAMVEGGFVATLNSKSLVGPFAEDDDDAPISPNAEDAVNAAIGRVEKVLVAFAGKRNLRGPK